jgi:predicted amidohydrolase YtcJ
MGAIALSSLPATARTQPTSSPSPTRQGQIADAAEADAIYTDGTILTMSDAQPTAVAVAVKDGKILAVGSKEEVRSFQGPDTQLINLGGHTLVPGFIDGHGHVVAQGISATMANLLPPPDGTVDTMAKLQDTLRAWSKSPISQKFGLIIGNGYDDSQLAEQRHPNRDDLDAVSTELPVVVIHQSGHLGAYNSKALEMLGITADTPNPQGGVYERRPNSQEPNGVMEEAAHSIAQSEILSQTVKIGPEQASEVVGLVEKGLAIYAQYGFTTAQEGLGNPGYFEVLKLGVHENRLNADIPLYMEYFMAATNAHELDWSRREYHGHLRLAGGKLVLDGSPQGRTAWLTEPYYKPPAGQPADYLGYPTLTDEQLLERIETGFKNNFQLICHCNGDAASDQLIRIVRTLTEKHGVADRRVVMIHAQMVREDQLDAMQELGIIPSFFPSHTFYWGDWHRDVTLGPKRAARISPTRSALQRGMKFTIHNDAPVVMPHAMRLLWSTVNRRTRSNQVLGADQAISPLDGLKALTIWGAYQHFEEDIKGSIEVGKLADFAILSANPTTVDSMTIRDIHVLETIKEGRTIYKASSPAGGSLN